MLTVPLSYTDGIKVRRTMGNSHQEDYVQFDDARGRLLTHPEGWQEVRFDQVIDLTSAGAKFVNALTLPAGAIVKYVAMQVTELVVAGGTTVKLALNLHTAVGTGDYLQLATLTKNTKKSALLPDATPLASPLAVDVNGVTTAGSALGDTNLSAGKVRVIMVYNVPAVLADVP